jgi:D-xylose transport system permease protein
VIGLLVAYLGIPSFVVTLALFLGLQGVLLKLIGEGGTIAVRDKVLLAINNDNLPVWAGWVLFVVVVGAYALVSLRRAATRRAGGLQSEGYSVVLAKVAVVAVLLGILIASRDNSISPTSGGAETLLYAVGAAVIGGTSLFGGKGKILDAVLGGLVIAVIINGMGLLNQPSAVVYMVTGVVLLIAASVDALSRRRAAASGRV